MGATNVAERVAASIGLLSEVEPQFIPAVDLNNAGVLLALPALLASGLLFETEKHFQLPKGYYGVKSIFLTLAFMALSRLRSMESLRYCAPGEWGKILGLDRIPEVRTLRNKVALLSADNAGEKWGAALSAQWLGSGNEETLGVLYVDGHVRVYHGSQTKLPRHYVSRQKLCLRGTTDYWVNAMDGQPFFRVEKPVDPGLLQVLEKEIIPRLEEEVPRQPTKGELENDRYLHRFCLVFDREGYSPAFFKRAWEKRVVVITYHKFPNDPWPEHEFHAVNLTLPAGNSVTMRLAERGVNLSGVIWLREIRKLTDAGHQVSILTTHYTAEITKIAVAMFSRWSQENFFKYMRENYSLDRLIDYRLDELPETTRVVNPAYRELDSVLRRKNSVLSRMLAKFATLSLQGSEIESFEEKKAALLEDIGGLQKEIAVLKEKRKETHKHIAFSELPAEQKFKRLSSDSKHFVDTIKMIAYRAETALAHVLREKLTRDEDARALLRAIFSAAADIIPDAATMTLTVNLHHLANHCSSAALAHLCNEMNATETKFPGTNYTLKYFLVS